jgi:hypothetical protein
MPAHQPVIELHATVEQLRTPNVYKPKKYKYLQRVLPPGQAGFSTLSQHYFSGGFR